jgi:predicted dehydrogenase
MNWGVVGTGAIAHDFVTALGRSRRCRVVNVVGSVPGKGAAFADQCRLPRASATLDELLADRDVDAVYVATPHPLHEPNALAAIAAGKAVLCEKPLALDAAGATRVCEAARARGVFLMEGFMYRCHPMLTALLQRLEAGCIGALRHVRATFGFRAPRTPDSRLFAPALGGGGILDVGGYPASFARLLAGLVERQPFAEPVALDAVGDLGPTGVDELATAALRFASGFTATLACAVRHELGTAVTIYGEGGRVELPDPWLPGGQRQGLVSSFTIYDGEGAPETVTVVAALPIYAVQAELCADARAAGAREPRWPAMGWRDSQGNLRVLDQWRAALSRAPAFSARGE